jgi:hypothetical protein
VTVGFTAPTDGTYAFDTRGSAFDTVLGVYDGCAGNELACNDFGPAGDALAIVDLLAGQSVTVVVDGMYGASGAFDLEVLEVLPEEIGCTDDADDDLDGLVDCVDPDCAADGACALVCPDDVLSGALPIVVNASTVGETADHEASCAPTVGASDLAWEFTAPAAANYRFDTAGSTFDTVLTVLDGCGGAELACNDNAGGGVQSGVQVALAAGQTVVVVVDGWDTASGPVTLNVR